MGLLAMPGDRRWKSKNKTSKYKIKRHTCYLLQLTAYSEHGTYNHVNRARANKPHRHQHRHERRERHTPAPTTTPPPPPQPPPPPPPPPFGRPHRLGQPMVVCVECLPADKPWDVVSAARRSSGVAPRACVRVYARVLVPPNLYIHTYTTPPRPASHGVGPPASPGCG